MYSTVPYYMPSLKLAVVCLWGGEFIEIWIQLLSSCELHSKYLMQSVLVAGVVAVAFAVLRKRARSAKAVNLSVGASSSEARPSNKISMSGKFVCGTGDDCPCHTSETSRPPANPVTTGPTEVIFLYGSFYAVSMWRQLPIFILKLFVWLRWSWSREAQLSSACVVRVPAGRIVMALIVLTTLRMEPVLHHLRFLLPRVKRLRPCLCVRAATARTARFATEAIGVCMPWRRRSPSPMRIMWLKCVLI